MRGHATGIHFRTHALAATAVCVITSALMQGCGPSATFKSPGSRGAAELNAMAVNVRCGENKVQLDRKALESAGGRVKLAGELCPTSSSSLHVLFVLDFSASMQVNDPVVGSGAAASCGRSKAVKAIVDRLTASRGKEDKISAGIVGFGSDASEVTGETDLAQFKPAASSMCRSDSGVTNYRAALELASQKLAASQKTTRILYFVSDGLPTAGGAVTSPIIVNPFDPFATISAMNAAAAINEDAHYRAGAEAASSLRSRFPGMIFNAMLLQPSSSVTGINFDPAQYLALLTGDAARVRVVSQASQLADSAVQLLTVPVALDPGNVDALVSNDSGARQTLTVQQLLQSQESKGKWIFSTSDFDVRKMAGDDFAKPIHFAMDAAEASGRKHALKFDVVIN
jgi:hypothetical protein